MRDIRACVTFGILTKDPQTTQPAQQRTATPAVRSSSAYNSKSICSRCSRRLSTGSTHSGTAKAPRTVRPASVLLYTTNKRTDSATQPAAPSAPGSTPNPSEPASDFGQPFIEAWLDTDNARIFGRATEPHLFDIIEPRHPCAGGLTVEDIQRRLAQYVSPSLLRTYDAPRMRAN